MCNFVMDDGCKVRSQREAQWQTAEEIPPPWDLCYTFQPRTRLFQNATVWLVLLHTDHPLKIHRQYFNVTYSHSSSNAMVNVGFFQDWSTFEILTIGNYKNVWMVTYSVVFQMPWWCVKLWGFFQEPLKFISDLCPFHVTVTIFLWFV